MMLPGFLSVASQQGGGGGGGGGKVRRGNRLETRAFYEEEIGPELSFSAGFFLFLFFWFSGSHQWRSITWGSG